MTELLQRNASQLQSRRQKSTVTGEVANPEEAQLIQQISDHFRVYFPTRDTVIHSRGGAGVGLVRAPNSIQSLVSDTGRTEARSACNLSGLIARNFPATCFGTARVAEKAYSCTVR